MRVIARRERPHPGAQLRLTDHDGWRITCFATNTKGPGWRLADLEVRHRQRARCRGPHPWPEGHRAAEPALPRLRPEPDLGRDRRPGRRPARLDPDPRLRPARARPTLGTQTPPVPHPRRRRTHHPHRPTQTTTTPTRLALEPPHRHRLGRTTTPPEPAPTIPTTRTRRTGEKATPEVHAAHHR